MYKRNNFIIKPVIIIISFVLSLLVGELIVKNFLKYPLHSPNYNYILNLKLKNFEYISLRPNRVIANFEDGYKKVKFNNIGLPGTDIDTNYNYKYIFLLGNSFIEALSVDENKISSSVFQNALNNFNPSYKVLNLGSSSHDFYIAYHRAVFFERIYTPELVIYVIESLERMHHYLRRYDVLDFNIDNKIGTLKNESNTLIFLNYIRNKSALFNLIADSYMQNSNNNTKDNTREESRLKYTDNTKLYNDSSSNAKIYTCLSEYKKKYKKYILVSIVNNKNDNTYLRNLCSELNIDFYDNYSIMDETNQINKTGHLNETGNYLLDKYLFEVFLKYDEKSK